MERAESDGTADAVVFAGLGMLGIARWLDHWLDVARAETTREVLDPDDPVLLASLGLLSLQRAARRWLAEAADPPRAAETARGRRSALAAASPCPQIDIVKAQQA